MRKNLTFGQALEYLKSGHRITRPGWNGRGMWLVLLEFGPELRCLGRKVNDCIAMRTVDDTIQPGWLASQADLLAADWIALPSDEDANEARA